MCLQKKSEVRRFGRDIGVSDIMLVISQVEKNHISFYFFTSNLIN